MTDKKEKLPEGLELMRKKFSENQISKLPKQAGWMKNKKDEYKDCNVCGGYHHPKAVHLDYVGHAALTDRLLDCDPEWNWEPMTFGEFGQPLLDKVGGLWIKLTVCGVTRIGYGHPDGKQGGDANKEVIGDALRNAAMRFGAALDLWHKGELHLDTDEVKEPESTPKPDIKPLTGEEFVMIQNGLKNATLQTLESEKQKAKAVWSRATKEQRACITKFVNNADNRLDDIPAFGGDNE